MKGSSHFLQCHYDACCSFLPKKKTKIVDNRKEQGTNKGKSHHSTVTCLHCHILPPVRIYRVKLPKPIAQRYRWTCKREMSHSNLDRVISTPYVFVVLLRSPNQWKGDHPDSTDTFKLNSRIQLKFSFHFTVNTLRLYYEDEPVNAVPEKVTICSNI